ncbi:7TM-DISM domain-containing protein [Runella sp. MFBS21]|uniref:sensor histidine kinase n=1 Tax=Runella sp. MFBS21 TaxID=3034018 RepID=UPI0023F7621A|nr:7TM-DISM domain-containing protein [Runella sp. MFBS21]MDF7817267.1 7TM-DISM domain-containing protein [Runella sp. MFBS21]
MPFRFVYAIILLSMVMWGHCAWCQVSLINGINKYTLGREVFYVEDAKHSLTFKEVYKQEKGFSQVSSINANFGFTNSSYWFKWSVLNTSEDVFKNWLLEVGYSAYAEVDLYVINRQGKVVHQAAGDWRGSHSRPLSYHNYVFGLPILPSQSYEIYLRVRPLAGQVLIPLTIWEGNTFTKYAEVYNLFWGIYMGMMLIVLLYHAILWFVNRKSVGYVGYLYLALYLVLYLIFELTRGSCIGVRYFWPENRWMVNNGFLTLFLIMLLLFYAFYGIMLNLSRYTPKLMKVINVLFIVWIGVVLSIYGGWIEISKNALTLIFGALVGGLIIVASYVSWRAQKGYKPGLYYFLAATMLYSGGLVLLLTRSGLLPSGSFYAMNSLNLGSLMEYLMLSVGLGMQIQWERQKNKQQIKDIQREQITMVENSYWQAQDEERKQLAMLLHDQFANEVLMLRQNIQKLYKEYIGTLSEERFKDALSIIKNILEGIRTIAHHYRPPQFEEKGLKWVLEELLQRLNSSTNVHFLMHLGGKEEELVPRVQEQLYYIIFEITSNIIKHAEATEAALISYRESNFYVLQIRDNGKGIPQNIIHSTGQGLQNLRRRLESIGGIYEVVSSQDSGTAILIKMNLLHSYPQDHIYTQKK